MTRTKKLLAVGVVALAICVASAVVAELIPVSDADGSPGWDTFGTAIYLTIFVTIPAGILATICLITGIVSYFLGRKKPLR